MKTIHASTAAKKQYGQGMTEYVIIVALIAVAAIAAFQFFGQAVRGQASGITNELGGNSSAAANTDVQNAGKDSDAQRVTKTLGNYSSSNAKPSK